MAQHHQTHHRSPSDPSPAPLQEFHQQRSGGLPHIFDGLTGAAHFSSGTGQAAAQNPETHFRASWDAGASITLEGKRKQVLDDVLELFCSRPSLEIFERSWRKDAVFEDPLSKCEGFSEYAPQWFGMPKLFPVSRTLSYRVLSSTHQPNRIVYAQKQEYTVRFLGVKKVMDSIVVIDLDEEEKIKHLQDKWNGQDAPTRYGSMMLRRLNARTLPFLVSVPKKDDK